MLVLTRKTTETIKIGNGITITILRVKGQTVRVGIEAPRDVRVIRGELPTKENEAESREEDDPAEGLDIPATDHLNIRQSAADERQEVIEFRFSPKHPPTQSPRNETTRPLAGRGSLNRLPLASLSVEGTIVKK